MKIFYYYFGNKHQKIHKIQLSVSLYFFHHSRSVYFLTVFTINQNILDVFLGQLYVFSQFIINIHIQFKNTVEGTVHVRFQRLIVNPITEDYPHCVLH